MPTLVVNDGGPLKLFYQLFLTYNTMGYDVHMVDLAVPQKNSKKRVFFGRK